MMLVDVLQLRAFKDGITMCDGRDVELKRKENYQNKSLSQSRYTYLIDHGFQAHNFRAIWYITCRTHLGCIFQSWCIVVHTQPGKEDPVQHGFWLPSAFLRLDKINLIRNKVREETHNKIGDLDIAMALRHLGAVGVQ